MENIKDNLQIKLEDKFDPDLWVGWRAFRDYKFAGLNLIDEINALDPDLVIDVGCGHNRFKGHIKNLFGFDQEPFPFADQCQPIEKMNLRPGSADALLILGSIQFGSRDFVMRQIAHVIPWVKPGGYIVMRTMRNHYGRTPYPHKDAHYIWQPADIAEVTEKYQLEVVRGVDVDQVLNRQGDTVVSDRLVWWWKTPGTRIKYRIDPQTCEITERP